MGSEMHALVWGIDVYLSAHGSRARSLDVLVGHLGHIWILLHERIHLAIESRRARTGGAAEALG